MTLNNHLPGAVCAVAALYAAVRIWFDGERRWRYFAVAGSFAGLLATEELPGASRPLRWDWRCCGRPRGRRCWASPRRRRWRRPASSAQTGSPITARPPYMHRGENDNWYRFAYERNGRQVESYWNRPRGIDRGEPSSAVYACTLWSAIMAFSPSRRCGCLARWGRCFGSCKSEIGGCENWPC